MSESIFYRNAATGAIIALVSKDNAPESIGDYTLLKANSTDAAKITKALAETKEEHEYLMKAMLPQMIVGGFVTVTITSVIIAGIFVGLL